LLTVVLENIRKFVEKKVAKGKLNQIQCDEILARLSGTTDMAQAVKGVVMVVEAVFEKF
jgi:3-hydroxyacyl-CoA dehydrogenase